MDADEIELLERWHIKYTNIPFFGAQHHAVITSEGEYVLFKDMVKVMAIMQARLNAMEARNKTLERRLDTFIWKATLEMRKTR